MLISFNIAGLYFKRAIDSAATDLWTNVMITDYLKYLFNLVVINFACGPVRMHKGASAIFELKVIKCQDSITFYSRKVNISRLV